MKILRLDEIKVKENHRKYTSSTSKGNQTKWCVDRRWVKANHHGYEDVAEVASTLVLKSSNLSPEAYVDYHLCRIIDDDTGMEFDGCYSYDFKPEGWSLVTVQNLLEKYGANFDILNGNKHSTEERIAYVVNFVYEHTELDITNYLGVILAFDAFILNEDRHLNNIAFLYKDEVFRVAPIFDNGLSLLSDTKLFTYDAQLFSNIRKVKSKTFSSDFKKQLRAVETPFKIDGNKLSLELENNKHILGRTYDVIHRQMGSYEGIIVF